MTTTLTDAGTTPSGPTPAAAVPDRRRAGAGERTPSKDLTFTRIVRSEWIKLRSLRSNWIMLAAAVVLLIGLGAIAAAVSSSGGTLGDNNDVVSPLDTVLAGSMFAVLVLGVLGCLHGAREFGSSMMTATLTAAPRRLHVLAAKAVVLAAVVLPAALVGSFGAWLAGTSVLTAAGDPAPSLTDGAVLGSVVGTAFWLTAISLIGLGLGVLLRSVAGSVSALIAGVLIVPAVAGSLLPNSWSTALDYLPSNAATTFTTLSPDSSLGTVAGIVVVLVWVGVALVAAGARFRTRDL